MKFVKLFSLLLMTLVILVGCKNEGFNLYTRDPSSGTRDSFFTGIGLKEEDYLLLLI